MERFAPLQLGELARRLNVDDRQLRYILEQGHAPEGVAKSPSTGNHRQFDPEQAFWLAVVVRLKQAGIKTPLAATIADFSMLALRGVTQNLSWDWRFRPVDGKIDTEFEYFLDVADLQHVRLVTSSCPSCDGLYEFPWQHVAGRRRKAEDIRPCVVVRLDLVQIARGIGGHKTDGKS